MLPCPVSRWLWPILRSYLEASLSLVAQMRPRFDPWVTKIPWRRNWQPTPVSLPGESQGQRSLVSYSPRGRKESDTTERLGDEVLSETAAWPDVSPSPTGRTGIYSRDSWSNGVVVRCAGLCLFLDCDCQGRICRFTSTFWGTQRHI